MKESMREAFLKSAKTVFCSGDPGPYPPGNHPGGYYLAEIVGSIVHCCGDERCASGFHAKCDRILTPDEIRRMGNKQGAQWHECLPNADEGSPIIRILVAIISGLGVTWLGVRWAETKSLSGWTGPVLGVLTVLLVLWLLRPKQKGL